VTSSDRKVVTETALYDLMVREGVVQEPAILTLGGRCIVGEWIPLMEERRGLILVSRSEGIRVIAEADSWGEAFQAYLNWVKTR
jgi:hypothetical protein